MSPFKAADILHGKMDASEFKEYIFAMLFLKRCSDVFDERRKQVIKELVDCGDSHQDAEATADLKDWYPDQGSFWVPPQSRYQQLIDDAHHNVGDALNTALAELAVQAGVQQADSEQLRGGLWIRRWQITGQPHKRTLLGDSEVYQIVKDTPRRATDLVYCAPS